MASKNDKKSYPNPLLTSSCTSNFFFWWLNDIVWHSRTHDLTVNDLYDTVPEDVSGPLSCSLKSVWVKELDKARKKNEKPSLWKTVTKVYCWDFIKLSLLPICYTATLIVLPEFLELIMSYFRPKSDVTSERAYSYGTALLSLMILRTVSYRNGYFHLHRLGMRVKAGFTSLIYEKMIRLPCSVNQKMSNSVISLLSIDVGRFELLFPYAPFILTVLLQLFFETYLIWRYIGFVATVAGVVPVILLNFPLQAIYSKVALKFRAKQGKRTDDRVSMIGEIVDGVKAVKMFVWEKYLEKLVYAARRLEMRNYTKIYYIQSVVIGLAANSYRLGAFMVTLIYTLQYGIITADKILPVVLHLYNLRLSFGTMLFAGVRHITDMHVSIKRIEDFLLSEEVDPSVEDIKDKSAEIISIRNVTSCWDEQSCIFKNINVSFVSKKLHAVVGSVGSGKSSLLKLILRDLKVVSGEVFVYGTVSYASQEPWLFNGSVRDNILFGEKYDEDRYEKIVNACALIEDFNQLPRGDQTLVGDRGSNLSGGQCARINLARAVYRDADIYLLDNPLSAVDTRIARKIMIDCFDRLLGEKTRILVTHNIQQLDDKVEIILLEHGQIEFRGSIHDFPRKDHYNKQLTVEQTEASKEGWDESQFNKSVVVREKSSRQNGGQPNENEKLISKGAMNMAVYSSYIKAGGVVFVTLVILTNFLFTMVTATFEFGLGSWTRKNDKMLQDEVETTSNSSLVAENKLLDSNNTDMNTLLLKFGVPMTLMIFTVILKNIFFFTFALKASENIHNCIFSQMMMTTLQFFETNSAGKVLNRFSGDMGVVDSALPLSINEVINMTFAILAVLLPAIMVNWWISIASIIATFIIVTIGKMYVKTIQDIKRLAGSAKSPILSFAASSLTGAVTIRAFRAENMVIDDFRARQDRQTAAQLLAIALSQALSLWLELANVGLLAFTTYFCIFLKDDSTYEGHVGMSIMQILNITISMSNGAKHTAEAFAHMTSVERVLHLKELEPETLVEEESSLKLTSLWPEQGQIVFEHLYLRYSIDNDPVLWDVNCTIKAGTKVGIVGRTGAGKSSLISALFRFAKLDGSILIDGVNTKCVDLYKLRSKLSIIPQEPLLFKGTLRKNLDLSGKLDDASLWSALENVELKHIFDSLDFSIERGGSNLSAGQRQLLCLARAILIKNKILILDEVTANVDTTTDAVIQKTIRNKFEECTVMTISHRLKTVMDSDKILVLDNGRVVEYDHPFLLLENIDSELSKLVEESGHSTKQELTIIAREAYENSETRKRSLHTSQQ